MKRVYLFTVILTVFHTAVFFPIAILVLSTADAQSGLLWIPLSLLDFPIAFLVDELYMWWWPFIVHGIFGTGLWILVGFFIDYFRNK